MEHPLGGVVTHLASVKIWMWSTGMLPQPAEPTHLCGTLLGRVSIRTAGSQSFKKHPTNLFFPSQSPRACFAQAQFDFSAQDPSQLSFRRGDIIEILERPDPHWWRGQSCGRVGFFPRSYVQPVHL